MLWRELSEKERDLVSEIAKKRCDHNFCAPPCGGAGPSLRMEFDVPVASNPQILELVRKTLFTAMGDSDFLYQINQIAPSFRYFLRNDPSGNVFQNAARDEQALFINKDFSEGCMMSPTGSKVLVFGPSCVSFCERFPAGSISNKKLS